MKWLPCVNDTNQLDAIYLKSINFLYNTLKYDISFLGEYTENTIF